MPLATLMTPILGTPTRIGVAVGTLGAAQTMTALVVTGWPPSGWWWTAWVPAIVTNLVGLGALVGARLAASSKEPPP